MVLHAEAFSCFYYLLSGGYSKPAFYPARWLKDFRSLRPSFPAGLVCLEGGAWLACARCSLGASRHPKCGAGERRTPVLDAWFDVSGVACYKLHGALLITTWP